MARNRDDIRNVGGAFGRVPLTKDGEPNRYYLLLMSQRRNVGRTAERREAIKLEKLSYPGDRYVYAYGMKIRNV